MAQTEPASKRVALVTGAAQGIGRCIALRLADDGLSVAVNDVPSKRKLLEEVVAAIEAKEGGRAVAVPADVSVEADVEAMIATAVKELGGLDVMVANAGIVAFAPLVDYRVEDWDRMISINLRGVMLCYKHAAIQMIKQGRGGRIIGASSQAGKQAMPHLSAYSASKFAIRGLTQTAALELSKHEITVNAYAPGAIRGTNIVDVEADKREDARLGLEPGTTARKRMEAVMSLKTPMADADVIASLVSYLAKLESYFITGQSISVNGGTVFD